MLAVPDCLDAVEPLAAAVYRSGRRPPRAGGPSRDELAREVRSALVSRTCGHSRNQGSTPIGLTSAKLTYYCR